MQKEVVSCIKSEIVYSREIEAFVHEFFLMQIEHESKEMGKFPEAKSRPPGRFVAVFNLYSSVLKLSIKRKLGNGLKRYLWEVKDHVEALALKVAFILELKIGAFKLSFEPCVEAQ